MRNDKGDKLIIYLLSFWLIVMSFDLFVSTYFTMAERNDTLLVKNREKDPFWSMNRSVLIKSNDVVAKTICNGKKKNISAKESKCTCIF